MIDYLKKIVVDIEHNYVPNDHKILPGAAKLMVETYNIKEGITITNIKEGITITIDKDIPVLAWISRRFCKMQQLQ